MIFEPSDRRTTLAILCGDPEKTNQPLRAKIADMEPSDRDTLIVVLDQHKPDSEIATSAVLSFEPGMTQVAATALLVRLETARDLNR